MAPRGPVDVTILQRHCTIRQSFRPVLECPTRILQDAETMKNATRRDAHGTQANRDELAELISQALPEDDGTVAKRILLP